MEKNTRTYLVGRQNSSVPCDICIPSSENSVSRKHLELTATADGRYYIVHVHQQNKTKVFRNGKWVRVGQDFVGLDEQLRLGSYETTVRALLDRLGGDQVDVEPSSEEGPPPQEGSGYRWDPERGTIIRPRNQ